MKFLNESLSFPSSDKTHASGIIAFGGDLSAERLMLAYKSGIFPWYEDGEIITWWCPNPRMVIIPEIYKTAKSIRNLLNRKQFQITHNQAFKEVIAHCKTTKRNGQNSTWITDEMEQAYINLHEKGFAKSVEVWENGKLVGGLYGVDLGHVFCGESMFSLVPNASKIAFVSLINDLKTKNYKLLDCQVYNDHLALLGAFEIAREDFMNLLKS
uniref:leucyl/phenylalanyl-tRNA--protein transferase n=1 Tax=Flavobacterium sp. TaxID=239 RepID=UPI0040498EFF